jgi:DNA-binding MarR family transcriptional regulator
VSKTTPDQLTEALQDFVKRLFSLADSDSFDALAALEVSFTQARTIFMLACATEPVAINEIAEGLGLSVAAAGRNVDQLVKLDLVDRHESPTDRRVKLVSLSAGGESIALSHMKTKLASIRTFATHLTPDVRQRLFDALQPILEGDALRPKKLENSL